MGADRLAFPEGSALASPSKVAEFQCANLESSPVVHSCCLPVAASISCHAVPCVTSCSRRQDVSAGAEGRCTGLSGACCSGVAFGRSGGERHSAAPPCLSRFRVLAGRSWGASARGSPEVLPCFAFFASRSDGQNTDQGFACDGNALNQGTSDDDTKDQLHFGDGSAAPSGTSWRRGGGGRSRELAAFCGGREGGAGDPGVVSGPAEGSQPRRSKIRK